VTCASHLNEKAPTEVDDKRSPGTGSSGDFVLRPFAGEGANIIQFITTCGCVLWQACNSHEQSEGPARGRFAVVDNAATR
jgi:hypothetical protein